MVPSQVNLFPIPLSKLAGGQELLINTVALGSTVSLLGGNLSLLQTLLTESFGHKNDAIITANLTAASAGFDYFLEHFADKVTPQLQFSSGTGPLMVLDGAEAIATAAIAAGLQFSAIYPMSPISNILSVLAAHQEQYGFIYKQPEDEISAIGMSIGASYAGARSMTATSGGGFCLMTESLGLAAMTETPLVIIEGMRPGPATGLPTWSGQGDLQFALHAHQGDFPRIVLAAGDAKEAFELTMEAFNLADKYQTPVIVLVDKNILDDDCSLPVFDTSVYQPNRGKITTGFNPDFARYHHEDDGISFRSLPGTGNFFIANSDEHDEVGLSTEESALIISQHNKRQAKLDTCTREDMPAPQMFGPQDAAVTLVSWGSNKGSILTALKNFTNVNYLHLTWMNPFPTEAVAKTLEAAKYLIDIESNSSAQLASPIREKTGINIPDKLLKYDGRPIFPEEIIAKLEGVLKG